MKKTIGLFFGGLSNEAEVSVNSAENVVRNFDYEKYGLALIYWHSNGIFYLLDKIEGAKNPDKKNQIAVERFPEKFDVALLMTHGKFGEDGVLQGLLECQKIKYCGCHVLSSALCMDKAVFKTFLAGQKINQVKFRVINYGTAGQNGIDRIISEIKNDFQLPVFVKPSNSGSSVGIIRIESFENINAAIDEARKYDAKIVIEEGLTGHQEIEIAVLGNKELFISMPGELIPSKEFYDYEEKYKLGKTKIVAPARITPEQTQEIKELAAKIYRFCDCNGFARIDFFVKDRIYVNEVNTLPGFTDISMFPFLMQKSGIPYRDLINKIIELAY
ncbi:MAG: D-alanine--D-alanine ligase [Parcubacteria group bacterium Licking1014_17]|nr:MAG: D-alanine--D-alanine ligase [Parcubacteria group bacterium Licking1014_17]